MRRILLTAAIVASLTMPSAAQQWMAITPGGPTTFYYGPSYGYGGLAGGIVDGFLAGRRLRMEREQIELARQHLALERAIACRRYRVCQP